MSNHNKPQFIGTHGSSAKPFNANVTVVAEQAKSPEPATTTPEPTHVLATPAAIQVAVGSTMFNGQIKPAASFQNAAAQPHAADQHSDKNSMIAEGVNFVGNAQLVGQCSVGGKVEGNLVQSPGQSITVVVAETGHVKGDIVADNISVMGQTDGLLDAGGGSVALHDASRVSGHVRYTRLQVNGADLNATLEKAATKRERPNAVKPA